MLCGGLRDFKICISCGGVGTVTDLGSGEERPCILCEKPNYDAWVFERQPATRRIANLDDKGRCCGRKPTLYKLPTPHLCCFKCNAEINPETGKQQQNWAWVSDGDLFVATSPTAGYARPFRALAAQEGE